MRRLILTVLAAVLGAAGLLTAAGPASAVTGTVISAHDTPFGVALEVGSGTYAGFNVYWITSDNSPSSFGCTTALLHIGPPPPISCTGPEGDKTAIWPAVTTNGPPVAGPGVVPSLLGTVVRPGVGTQVTYAGHPIYMFDNGPNMVSGQGFQDPASPLPHGTWFLVRPSDGSQLPWTPVLTTVTLGGHQRLAVLMQTLAGWVRFPAYTRSGPCTGTCARVWPYVLTAGFPGAAGGVHPGRIGLTVTALGVQVTYRGRPLYLFSQEQLSFTTFLAAGNGNGVGGFHLVSP